MVSSNLSPLLLHPHQQKNLNSGPHLALETITLPAREDGSAGHVIYTVPDFASKEERAALIAASNAALENNEIANTEICEPKPDEIGTALAFLAKVPIATKMTETLLERLLSLVEDQLLEMAHLLFGKLRGGTRQQSTHRNKC